MDYKGYKLVPTNQLQIEVHGHDERFASRQEAEAFVDKLIASAKKTAKIKLNLPVTAETNESYGRQHKIVSAEIVGIHASRRTLLTKPDLEISRWDSGTKLYPALPLIAAALERKHQLEAEAVKVEQLLSDYAIESMKSATIPLEQNYESLIQEHAELTAKGKDVTLGQALEMQRAKK